MNKGFKIPGNMQDLMKQAQRMQQEIAKAQEEAGLITGESSVGGGAVKATANGKSELLSIEIMPEVVNPNDVEMLKDLILTAVNEALAKAQSEVKESMKKVTGGMNIPGL